MALHATRWATIRKGVVLGLFTGWLYFINYAMYAFGFIIGSFFMHYQGHDHISITKILLVSYLFEKSVKN
jgi:hypothetical protein